MSWNLIGTDLFSDDANRFIRMKSLKGKPLEVQYESTRELDMDQIERELIGKWKHLVKKIVQSLGSVFIYFSSSW